METGTAKTLTIAELKALLARGNWATEQDCDLCDLEDEGGRVSGWVWLTHSLGDIKLTYLESVNYNVYDADSFSACADSSQAFVWQLVGAILFDEDGDKVSADYAFSQIQEDEDVDLTRFTAIDYSGYIDEMKSIPAVVRELFDVGSHDDAKNVFCKTDTGECWTVIESDGCVRFVFLPGPVGGVVAFYEFAFREGNAKASEKLQAWMLEKGIDELDASDFFDFLSDEYSLKLRKQDEQAGGWVG